MERVVAIAVKTDKDIVRTHPGARRHRDIPANNGPVGYPEHLVEGFVTESGTFLSKHEAYLQALRSGQVFAKAIPILEPEDIF